MKVNEVTESVAEFATTLDEFIEQIRRHANAKFIGRLKALHKHRKKPYDGEVAREAIKEGVKHALPSIGFTATFDPSR